MLSASRLLLRAVLCTCRRVSAVLNQMGIKFLKVMCDEHGIGGDGWYCGGNGA
jgi:hypothetical protein